MIVEFFYFFLEMEIFFSISIPVFGDFFFRHTLCGINYKLNGYSHLSYLWHIDSRCHKRLHLWDPHQSVEQGSPYPVFIFAAQNKKWTLSLIK